MGTDAPTAIVEPASDELVALREAREAELLRLEIRSITEAWGDIVDTQAYLRDDPSFGVLGYGRPVAFTSLDDRADGRFRPVYETEQDLALSRASARNLVLITGVRTGALDTLANYTLAGGFAFKVEPENDTERQAVLLARAVQDTVDRFVDENDFNGVIDREIHLRSREDGEAIVGFDEEEICAGRVLLEFIEPDQLTEPLRPDQLEDWLASEYPECCTGNPECWKFGVHTPARKTWKPLGYHVVRDGRGADWDYYPASRVEHIKRNVTRNAKRGVSDFLEILTDLQREAKLCGNMIQGASLQSAIAWILQGAQGQTSSQLSSVGGIDRAQKTVPSGFVGGSAYTQNATRYPAGSILKVGFGQEYLPGPMGAERNVGFEVVGQYALRRIGVRWSMPEYMISGDASNNNRASSETAESPFVKAREADQQFYKRHFLSLIWKAVKIHVESGRFVKYGIQRGDYETLMRLIRIDAECPTVASRDPKVAVDSDKVLVDGGVMAKATWAARNGLDYEKEQKLGAMEKAPEPSPFGVVPGLGAPAQPGQQQAAAPPEPNPKGQPLGESWDETKHPRDPEGEGGGQFVSAGGVSGGSGPDVASSSTKSGSASKAKSRAKIVRDEASKIEFTDEKVGASSGRPRDLQDVRDAMTPHEMLVMDEHLEEVKGDWVEKRLERYNPDEEIDAKDVAIGAGWGDEDIESKARSLVDSDARDLEMSDEDRDAIKDEVEGWYKSTRLAGTDAIDELHDHLRDSDIDVPHEVLASIRGLKSDAEPEIEAAMDSERDKLTDAARDDIAAEYDSEGAWEGYLNDFYDENSDRFEGSGAEGQWGKDGGDDAFAFSISGGAKYQIWAQEGNFGGQKKVEIGFHDAKGAYGVTGEVGARGAAEVFKSVTTAVVAYALKKSPDFMSFTAAEDSRQKLYDRLVRSTADAVPDYHAIAVPGKPRRYILAKRSKMDVLKEYVSLQGGNFKVETLVESEGSTWMILTPMSRADWFSESGWKDGKIGSGERRPKKPQAKKTSESTRMAAVKGALESVETTAEARAILETLESYP